MRLALVIFKKDVRRFWWEILITWALLALLTWHDVQRYDFVPGPMEALLNVFLPIAWSYLIAIVVQEDGMVGGRQFWMTRPIPTWAIAVAKALFFIASIHLPALIADLLIVGAHGHPTALSSLGPLLLKQVLLAVVITLPSAALAAVTETLMQFAPAAFAIGAAGVLIVSSKLQEPVPWQEPDTGRRVWSAAILLAVASAVLAVQYLRRRTGLARAIGLTAVVCAGIFFASGVSDTDTHEYRAGNCGSGGVPIVVEQRPGALAETELRARPARTSIPVAIRGVPGSDFEARQISLQIKDNSGEAWTLPRRLSRADWSRPDFFAASLSAADPSNGVQFLHFGPEMFRRLANRSVTIKGQAEFVFLDRQNQQVAIREAMTGVPGLGRCRALVVADPMRDEMLKVYCESLGRMIARTPVVLSSAGREWRNFLGDSMTSLGYSWHTWLSPLTRRQTFFHLDEGPGDNWRPPREGEKRVIVRVTRRTGCQVVNYELQDIRIEDLTALCRHTCFVLGMLRRGFVAIVPALDASVPSGQENLKHEKAESASINPSASRPESIRWRLLLSTAKVTGLQQDDNTGSHTSPEFAAALARDGAYHFMTGVSPAPRVYMSYARRGPLRRSRGDPGVPLLVQR